MDSERRIAPLRHLWGRTGNPAAGTGLPDAAFGPRRAGARWLASAADPEQAWAGRVALDRGRVQARPDDTDGWWRLGHGLLALGRTEAASAAFGRALRGDLGAATPGSVAAFVVRRRSGLELSVDLARAAGDLDRPAVWICPEPVGFEYVRAALGARAGAAYFVADDLLVPLLGAARHAALGAVLSADAEDLQGVGSGRRRVRMPRRFTDAPDPHDGRDVDAVLCPTRASAAAWASAAPSVRCIPTRWPAAPPIASPDVPGEFPTSVLVLLHADATRASAWTNQETVELLDVLTSELRTMTFVVDVAPARAVAFARAWSEASVDAPRRERVRLLFGGHARPSARTAWILVEPEPESIAHATSALDGPWVSVYAPRGGSPAGNDRLDSPLRVVARWHADPTSRTADRARLRATLFFAPGEAGDFASSLRACLDPA